MNLEVPFTGGLRIGSPVPQRDISDHGSFVESVISSFKCRSRVRRLWRLRQLWRLRRPCRPWRLWRLSESGGPAGSQAAGSGSGSSVGSAWMPCPQELQDEECAFVRHGADMNPDYTFNKSSVHKLTRVSLSSSFPPCSYPRYVHCDSDACQLRIACPELKGCRKWQGAVTSSVSAQALSHPSHRAQ